MNLNEEIFICCTSFSIDTYVVFVLLQKNFKRDKICSDNFNILKGIKVYSVLAKSSCRISRLAQLMLKKERQFISIGPRF